MRTDRFWLWSAVAALGLLASLTCENRAHAQVTTGNDLELGGSFNGGGFYTFNGSSPGGGGPIDTSYLNGVQLPWVYCIDIPDNVYVPDSYKNTTVATNGTAIYGSGNPSSWATGGLVSPPNANVIAGLVNTWANSATTTVQQDALQAAIWTAIYGYNTPGYAACCDRHSDL